MDPRIVFVNRRKGLDRREDADPCSTIPMDLYHRKRRKSLERRDVSKSLTDDYYSYMQKVMKQIQANTVKARAIAKAKTAKAKS